MEQQRILQIVWCMVVSTFLLASVSALLVTYEGSIVTTHETFALVVGTEISVTGEYTVVNQGGGVETVALSFPQFPKHAVMTYNGSPFTGTLTLQPRAQAVIHVQYTLPLTNTRSFAFNPELLLNGYVDDHRIGNIETTFSFVGSTGALQSPSDFIDQGIVEGTHVYQYTATNVYQPSFTFSWLTSDPHIQVSRTHSAVSTVGDILRVNVHITNTGEQFLKDIKLEDSFLQSTFEPVMPLSEFRAFASEVEAPYVWEHTIAGLAPGASETIEYSVRVKQMGNLRTLPLSVFVDGQLVASVDGAFFAQPSGPTDEQ